MKAEEEARLVENARQEAKENEHAQLKVEEGVLLALEARRRADKEDLRLKAEEARLKSETEEQARLKAEEEYQIAEEARLKAEEHRQRSRQKRRHTTVTPGGGGERACKVTT